MRLHWHRQDLRGPDNTSLARASTGTDAQPYFRIFNPMTQGERYDLDAEYVGEFVPELRETTPERVHSWHELTDDEREAVAPDYPDPIVDRGERRGRALDVPTGSRGGRGRGGRWGVSRSAGTHQKV